MTNFSLAVIPSQGIIIILLSLTLGKFQVPYNNRKLQAKLYPASSEGSVWTCDCLLSTLSVRSDSQENNTVKCQDQHFSLSLFFHPSWSGCSSVKSSFVLQQVDFLKISSEQRKAVLFLLYKLL